MWRNTSSGMQQAGMMINKNLSEKHPGYVILRSQCSSGDEESPVICAETLTCTERRYGVAHNERSLRVTWHGSKEFLDRY